MTALRIEKLVRAHAVEAFTCGQADLDRFLIRHALQAQHANASQTYVACEGDKVVSFYTLVFGEALHADAPARVVKGMPRHPIPLMIVARVAVHSDWQGKGLGSGMLRDAMRRTLQAAEIGGLRALTVHAKDDGAAAFYRHFGFVAAPTDPLHLFMLIKDIRLAAGGSEL